MAGLIPPLLLALFAAWCGNFAGAATFAGSAGGEVALLAVLVWAAPDWRDPLQLGRARLLPWALWGICAASAALSPVPRAAWTALVLLPGFLLLPAAVARCWKREEDRHRGFRAIALLAILVSLWALIDWRVRGLPRVATPLGHHNLLANWLVLILPLAALPVRERGAWRWIGGTGVALAVLTVLATRSLAGTVALGVEALLAVAWLARRSARGRTLLACALLALAVVAAAASWLQKERVRSVLLGEDLSVRERAVYYRAGVEGFRERPALGWGPGSAAWTAAERFRPIPGVSPWGEVIGDLHCLPLQIAYEAGAAGLLASLVLAGLFAARRVVELRRAEAPALAGLVALAGAAAASLAGWSPAVTALPVAAAVAAGAALSVSGSLPEARRWPVRAYAALAVLALALPEAARGSYDRAVAAAFAGRTAEARLDLARAARLDPSFPLYRLRLGLLRGDARGAELARAAADDARGVSPFWTVAGVLGVTSGSPWGTLALHRACTLDPLGPFPPFYLLVSDPGSPEAPRRGAHALLAEPRLAASPFWETRPALLAQAVEQVRVWPGVDAGWKEGLIAAIASLPPPGELSRLDLQWLALEIDTDESLALSLHVFRRRAWPAEWPLVPIRAGLVRDLPLPPATARGETAPDAFTAEVCGSAGRPVTGQRLRIR